MHIPLRERYRDTLGVESAFHLARHIPVDGPVVRGPDPWATYEIDRGIREFMKFDDRRRVLQNKFMFTEIDSRIVCALSMSSP